ncbi:hypothetical protein [Ferrimonas marina]|uniref:Uncharacterized protein n=1 Tax=Ferrimonas marina TaxID=299255 RepID=A0A1M5UJZ4_9GAMM|nr:hypothetical protein [Ferrimonas marina]SHH62983.1 hypothetical protein SAMN02745129_2596 [Ferrimonas marina]
MTYTQLKDHTRSYPQLFVLSLVVGVIVMHLGTQQPTLWLAVAIQCLVTTGMLKALLLNQNTLLDVLSQAAKAENWSKHAIVRPAFVIALCYAGFAIADWGSDPLPIQGTPNESHSSWNLSLGLLALVLVGGITVASRFLITRCATSSVSNALCGIEKTTASEAQAINFRLQRDLISLFGYLDWIPWLIVGAIILAPVNGVLWLGLILGAYTWSCLVLTVNRIGGARM